MMLDMKSILLEATRKGYGVAAPSVFDGKTIEACFEAAMELHAPMVINASILQDLNYMAMVVRFFEKKYSKVPVALNLDHGRNLKSVMQAIQAGFTSVMIDCSQLPLEENIRGTVEIVKLAHAVGVSVEAELGYVGLGAVYENNSKEDLTRPEEVEIFVEQTQVDCLAISIGNAHGLYSGKPYLDLERLDTIRKVTDIPLVLHGGSSTGEDNLKAAVRHGISKVNIGTDLRLAAVREVREKLADDGQSGTRFSITSMGMQGWKAELMHYMRAFGEEGRW